MSTKWLLGGAILLTLGALGQNGERMVNSMSTNVSTRTEASFIRDDGNRQKRLAQAESDKAIDIYEGGCIFVDQFYQFNPDVPTEKYETSTFQLGTITTGLNPGSRVCNFAGATGITGIDQSGQVVVTESYSVSPQDMCEVLPIINDRLQLTGHQPHNLTCEE